MNRRALLWTLVGLAALILAGLGLAHFVTQAPAGAAPQIGWRFQMVEQTGQPVDERLLKGKWSTVFFGYTFCPDVCPTTLQSLAAAQDQLGPKARNLQVVFVSVDPARDTPKQLKDYLSSKSFPAGVIGLTGSDAQVAAIAKAYKVFYAKQGAGTNYPVIYLMNPRGAFDSVMAYDLPPEQLKGHILKAMQGG